MSAPAAETVGKRVLPPWWVRWAGVPTGWLVGLSVVPLALSIGVLASRAVIVPVLALDVVLIAVALFDLAFARGQLAVSRAFPPVQSVGHPFDVTVRVWNVGRRTLRVRFTDDAPGKVTGLPASGTLAPGAATEAVYALTMDRRGQYPFGPITVRFVSPLGLWERQERFDVTGIVRTYPDFAQLRETGLRGRLSEQRAPVRARRRPGGENEFQRLRPYVAGDPYRHIDWKATARRRDFVTREFGQESNQNLIFLLDCGRMMSARSGSLTAFDHALNAAVLLGQVALQHGDRVGLLAFDSDHPGLAAAQGWEALGEPVDPGDVRSRAHPRRAGLRARVPVPRPARPAAEPGGGPDGGGGPAERGSRDVARPGAGIAAPPGVRVDPRRGD